MREFSITECMSRLNIKEGTKSDKIQRLYCSLDKLILNERVYLANCMSDKYFERADNVERDVWRGILLRSVKMAMESELGGAIKQDIHYFHSPVSENEQGMHGKIYWVSTPERCFKFTMGNVLTAQQKAQARKDLDAGRISLYCNVFTMRLDDMQETRAQFEFECDVMDWDKISLRSPFCYQRGIGMNLQMASEDGQVADTLENEWQTYQKMTIVERFADFNRFVKEIRYVNGLEPRPITRHNDGNNPDNQRKR